MPRDTDEFLIAIGERIRQIRNSRNISQEALAYRCGLHRTHMSLIERGQGNPGIRTLAQIVDALDVSFEEFFRGIE